MKWSNEARIGLAAVGAVSIFLLGVIYLRGIDLRSSQYPLKVFYRNVNGLKEGDNVTVAGLSIGHVESMSLAGRGITVNLSIQTDVRLPRDSKAILKSESIMGGKFIEIRPGIDSLILQKGDSLSGLYEADLSELTATLSPISSNVLGILENVNSTFDQQTRKRIQDIVADMERSSARLEEVIRTGAVHADRALADFSAFSRDMARFARTLDTIALTHRTNIDTSLTAFSRLTVNLDRVSEKLQYTTESFNEVLTTIRNGEGTIGKLVQEEKLYNDVDSLSVNLNLLIKDFQLNPQRYVKISLF